MVALSWLVVAVLAIMPISEARGAVIYGLSMGLNPLGVLFVALLANIAIVPVIFYILQHAHFREFVFRLFRKSVENKVQNNKKFELLKEIALLGFVAAPLPFTGAFSAALISELLGWNWKKSAVAISLGVLIAGTIVWASTLGVLKLISL